MKIYAIITNADANIQSYKDLMQTILADRAYT